MAGPNILNLNSKVAFAFPLTLSVAASDPVSAVAGDMYFNSVSQVIRYYDGSGWATVGNQTYLPSGSNLSGTYPTSLVVDGNAALIGNTTVDGDLIVNGNLTNSGGWSLNIGGDLIINGSLLFTPTNPSATQGNVTVGGKCALWGESSFQVNAGQSPQFIIGGDLLFPNFVSDNNVMLNGTGRAGTGAQGLFLKVFGSISQTDANILGSGGGIDVSGADNASGNGGNGGNIVVANNFTWMFMHMNGGSSTALSGNGGNGGNFIVAGSMTLYDIQINGGNAGVGGTAGAGGQSQTADASFYNNMNANGGNAVDVTGTAGPGGSMTFWGDLNLLNGGISGVSANGGDGGGGQGGNGGSITIQGTTNTTGGSGGPVTAKGGNSGSTHTGGSGGTLILNGESSVHGLDVSGGNSVSGVGGAGGSITSNGNLVLNAGGASFSGGTGSTAGAVGLCTIYGSTRFALSDANLCGNYYGPVSVTGNSSLLGSTSIDGDFSSTNVSNSVGAALTVNGDFILNGALHFTPSSTVIAQGNLIVNGDTVISAISDFQVNHGQSPEMNIGGDLSFRNFASNSTLLDGRGVPTTGANGLALKVFGSITQMDRNDGFSTGGGIDVSGADSSTANAGNGGSIIVGGDFTWMTATLTGGNSSFATGNGGNGGLLAVAGMCAVARPNVSGGSAGSGGIGGNGGTMQLWGPCAIDFELHADGGAAIDATGTAGNGGTVNFYSSCTMEFGGGSGGMTAKGGDGGGGQGGNGGTIEFVGLVNLPQIGSLSNSTYGVINVNGGNSGATFNGGIGGNINLDSGAILNGLHSDGGSASGSGNGGNAGNITIGGNLLLYGSISYNGGTGTASGALGIFNVDGNSIFKSACALNGSYGAVTAESDCTLLGNTIVNGALLVAGNFINQVGASLSTLGDLIGVVATTDATQTTLQMIPTATDTSYLLEADVVARRTGGSAGSPDDSAVYKLWSMVKNVAGTVTVTTPTIPFQVEDQVAWDATLDVSGTNVRVRVTGAANNNVTWRSSTKMRKV